MGLVVIERSDFGDAENGTIVRKQYRKSGLGVLNVSHGISKNHGVVTWQLLISLAGWILAIPLLWFAAPRIYGRLIVRIPVVQQDSWAKTLQGKHAQLAATQWKDPRPLHAFFGDSQVELGQWYDLCEGVIAIRNCGLSSAKIEDVTNLLGAVLDRKVDTILLMCGINNIGRDEPVPSCTKKYAKLLSVAREHLQPRRIVVISVMPVRQSLADQRARFINQNVSALNGELRTLCHRNNALFIDVSEAVTDSDGGLSERLTFDGLHLNPAGYKAIAAVICRYLTQSPTVP